MTPDQNKALYPRFIDQVFNEGRLEMTEEVLSPAYVFRDAPPGTPSGPEGIKKIVTLFRGAFPDLEITIEDQVAEADKVCSRTIMRGTHRGPIFGLAPTGKAVTMTGMTMVRVADGRLVESWVRNDVMGLMSQLAAGSAAQR